MIPTLTKVRLQHHLRVRATHTHIHTHTRTGGWACTGAPVNTDFAHGPNCNTVCVCSMPNCPV